MNKFVKHRVHFNFISGTNNLRAHSDPIKPDEFEEWVKDFGFGYSAVRRSGDLHWHADPTSSGENSIQLLKEWLATPELVREFPKKAAVLREMLARCE